MWERRRHGPLMETTASQECNKLIRPHLLPHGGERNVMQAAARAEGKAGLGHQPGAVWCSATRVTAVLLVRDVRVRDDLGWMEP